MDDRDIWTTQGTTRRTLFKQGFAVTVAGGATAWLLAACGGSSSTSSSASAAEFARLGVAKGPGPAGKRLTGTIVYGNAEPPTSAYWDPHAAFGLADAQTYSLVFDQLFRFSPEGKLEGLLAKRWYRTSPTVLRVELDPRAHFSDGRPVTGNDVKASIERLFEGKGLLLAFAFTEGTTVNVIDEHTVDIVTPEPFGPLESNLVYLSIIPESDARNPSVFKQRPLGSGPYTFVSYDNDTVTLEANPKYWKGVPGPKTVKLQYIEDPNARLNALLTGQIDIYTRGNSLALDATKGKHNFYVVNITPPSQFIYIPQYSGALNDVRVRQAIAYAIDRSSIAKKIIQIDPPAMSSLPAGSIGFRPLSPPFGFDLKKAQALLKEAGIEKGTKLTMASADIFQKQPEVDQVVKYSLEQLGFNVELTTLEAGKFRTTYPEYELSLNALGSQPDPDMLLSFFTPGTTEPAMHWNGHAFQPVLNKTRTTLGKAREGAIDAAAKYLWENQTVIYLTDDIWYTICSEKVREYTRPPTEMESWVWDATTV